MKETDYQKPIDIKMKSKKGKIRDRYEECVKQYFNELDKTNLGKGLSQAAKRNNTTEMAVDYSTQHQAYSKTYTIDTPATDLISGLIATIGATFCKNLPAGVPLNIYNQLESKLVFELKRGMTIGYENNPWNKEDDK